MLPWLLLAALLLFSLLTVVLYLLSVRPEAWSQRIGPRAYPLSGRLRTAAMVSMFTGLLIFVAAFFFPPALPMRRFLPWPYEYSLMSALALAIPAGYFLVRGVKDAGEEAAVPDPNTPLFGGIYLRVRHPQAWEGLAWPVLALLLHSTFHLLFASFWLVLEWIMVMAEEVDLQRRFGSEYEAYRRRTPAFLPRLRKG